jgi:hypothetical protein
VRVRVTALMLLLVIVSFAAAGCDGLSCSGFGTGTSTTTAATVAPTTTTLAPTTTTSSTTTTTLSPAEAYRLAMKGWADEYGPGLSQAYSVMSGANFVNPTPAQIQAAKDLDALMARMVPDLQAIQAPPELASAHAGFLSSLQKMSAGVHDLAVALENGQGLSALAAVAKVAAAWQEGGASRATLEQALGFSLSG